MTAQRKIRIGLIGASASRGWGAFAHVPALQGLEEFELVAIGASRQDTANEAAEKFGVRLAFGDAEALARHADVDVVGVAVRVTEHEQLVRAVLSAGKHVYCEWPLGVSTAQARLLAGLADRADVRTLVGLQGYCSAGARTVRRLLEDGIIGRLTAVGVMGFGGPHGPRTAQAYAYTLDEAAGATILSVSAAHWLATLEVAVGRLKTLTAVVARVSDETIIEETGERAPVNAPDQVVLAGILDHGAVMSIAVHSGATLAAPAFEARIVGTEGTLLISPAGPGTFQMADWKITVARRDGSAEVLPTHEDDSLPGSIPPGPPRNVARMYRAFGRAVIGGGNAEPDFRTAVRFHELVDAINRASGTGTRQEIG